MFRVIRTTFKTQDEAKIVIAAFKECLETYGVELPDGYSVKLPEVIDIRGI